MLYTFQCISQLRHLLDHIHKTRCGDRQWDRIHLDRVRLGGIHRDQSHRVHLIFLRDLAMIDAGIINFCIFENNKKIIFKKNVFNGFLTFIHQNQ